MSRQLDRAAREFLGGASHEPLARAGAVTVRLSDVKPERVTWLWHHRIPFGKLTVIDGDPGLGKSTMTLDIAARITRGTELPDGGPCQPAPVLILSAEDGLSDTIRPRLDAAGADCTSVHALSAIRLSEGGESFPSIAEHVEQIEREINETGARLVLIDPLMAYLGSSTNSWKDQDVRRVLAPLATAADRTRAAVVMVRHLTKGGGAQAIYRGGGSIGIIGAARSGLLVAKDPDDESRRVLAAVKSNLCAPPPSLAFRLKDTEGVASVVWGTAPVDISADRLLELSLAASDEKKGQRAEAQDFLRQALRDGERPSTEILKEARGQGFAERTIRRALRAAGGKARKLGFKEGWTWVLSEDAKAAISGDWQSSEDVGSLRQSIGEIEPCPYFVGEARSGACQRCSRRSVEHTL